MPTDGVLFSAHQFQALWSPFARYMPKGTVTYALAYVFAYGPGMCVLVVWPGIVPDNHPLAGQVRLTRCRGTMGAPTPGREADRPGAFLTTLPTLEDRLNRED